jgi:hypothetical protein
MALMRKDGNGADNVLGMGVPVPACMGARRSVVSLGHAWTNLRPTAVVLGSSNVVALPMGKRSRLSSHELTRLANCASKMKGKGSERKGRGVNSPI